MMRIAKAKGAETLNGAWMLAGQGALAFEHFFNKKTSVENMYNLLKRASE